MQICLQENLKTLESNFVKFPCRVDRLNIYFFSPFCSNAAISVKFCKRTYASGIIVYVNTTKMQQYLFKKYQYSVKHPYYGLETTTHKTLEIPIIYQILLNNGNISSYLSRKATICQILYSFYQIKPSVP